MRVGFRSVLRTSTTVIDRDFMGVTWQDSVLQRLGVLSEETT